MEWLVRVSIWGSVLCWAAAVALLLAGKNPMRARWFWTAGLAAFAIHVAGAFQGFYQWNHGVALVETARQTAEMTGWNSGAGLWFNYLFGLVWLADALFWWGGGDQRYFSRPRWISLLLHGFFVFMIFNGAVIFVENPGRWIGISIFVGLAALWLHAKIHRRSASDQ